MFLIPKTPFVFRIRFSSQADGGSSVGDEQSDNPEISISVEDADRSGPADIKLDRCVDGRRELGQFCLSGNDK